MPEQDRSVGEIRPDTLYTLEEAKRRTGWKDHAFRKARRSGLQVYYLGRRAFVMGNDLISHIKQHGVR